MKSSVVNIGVTLNMENIKVDKTIEKLINESLIIYKIQTLYDKKLINEKLYKKLRIEILNEVVF